MRTILIVENLATLSISGATLVGGYYTGAGGWSVLVSLLSLLNLNRS